MKGTSRNQNQIPGNNPYIDFTEFIPPEEKIKSDKVIYYNIMRVELIISFITNDFLKKRTTTLRISMSFNKNSINNPIVATTMLDQIEKKVNNLNYWQSLTIPNFCKNSIKNAKSLDLLVIRELSYFITTDAKIYNAFTNTYTNWKELD